MTTTTNHLESVGGFAFTHAGKTRVIPVGAVVAADDPAVKARPDMFFRTDATSDQRRAAMTAAGILTAVRIGGPARAGR
jgi:hypothetical protein